MCGPPYTRLGPDGSALISGLASKTLLRVAFDGNGGACQPNVGKLVGGPRFEVAPDGAVWMIEDSKTGGRFYVAPKGNWVHPYAMQVF